MATKSPDVASSIQWSVSSDKPIFVVFAMENCPACEMCKKFIEKVCTEEQKRRISFVDVKDPKMKEIVISNKISAIPTIYQISLKHNKVLPRIEGFDAKKLDRVFRSD